MSSVTMMSS